MEDNTLMGIICFKTWFYEDKNMEEILVSVRKGRHLLATWWGETRSCYILDVTL